MSSWDKAAIVIIDNFRRQEIADYVEKLMRLGVYINYQWYPGLDSAKMGLPYPAVHVYEDKQACESFSRNRKTSSFGLKATINVLEEASQALGENQL